MSVSLVGCDKGKSEADKKKEKVDKDAKEAKVIADKAIDDKAKADKVIEDKKIDDKAKADKKLIDDAAAAAKDAKDADKVAAAKLKTDLAALKFKAIDDTDVKKKGDTTVKVELNEAAPADLTLSAWVTDVKKEVLSGTGTIKKGAKTGEVTITTVDAKEGATEIFIGLINGTETVTKTTLKAKVK